MPLSRDNHVDIERIKDAYDRRKNTKISERYRVIRPEVMLARHERERATAKLLLNLEPKLGPVEKLKVLEIGCGSGLQLLSLMNIGFKPQNLVGNELMEERLQAASQRLPESLRLILGDACGLSGLENSFDIVYQATVFTSILDSKLRAQLSKQMWSWVRPGGGVLWYDFIYDNPNNPDVSGIKLKEVCQLFPEGEIIAKRVTLLPPLARFLAKIHPVFCSIFNMVPFFRSHLLVWIQKQ